MADELRTRFTANMARVDTLLQGSTAGFGFTHGVHPELLRAAIVLMHASIEDVLRSLEEARLPSCAPEVFRDFSFVLPSDSRRRPQKITLAELLEYRGQMVDDVLRATIREYLDTANYNNATEVVVTLRRIGIRTDVAEQHAATVETLMRRRHWIAHRADQDPNAPAGTFATRAVDPADVHRWRDAVAAVGYDVLGQLAPPGGP